MVATRFDDPDDAASGTGIGPASSIHDTEFVVRAERRAKMEGDRSSHPPSAKSTATNALRVR